MKLFVGDYLADTGHLRTIEHGAYLLLIMHYWRTGPLPDSDVKLARVARMSSREWAMHGAAVRALFVAADGLLRHKRVENELSDARARADHARTAANARHNTKPLKRNGTADARALPEHQSSMDRASVEQCPIDASHSHSQKEDKEGKKEKPPRASRLPADWTPSVDDRAFARELRLYPDAVAPGFVDYWRALPGAKGTKADWPATWRNWCRRQAERPRPGRSPPGRPGKTDWMDAAAPLFAQPPRPTPDAPPIIDADEWNPAA